MHTRRNNNWIVLFLIVIFSVTGCSEADKELEPDSKVIADAKLQSMKPDPAEIKNVITAFLDREHDVPFQMWAISDGKVVASMTGETKHHQWHLKGKHANQSKLQLSGKNEEVKWETKSGKGEFERSLYSLYSPHEHLEQLINNYNHVSFVPGSHFEQQQWTKIQLNMADDKVEEAVKTRLGEQFVTPKMLENVSQRMEVRYTLWYNKKSHDLHQVQMKLLKRDGSIARELQSLIFLFGEPAN